MESIQPPKTFKVYALIKQSGLALSYVGFNATNGLGTGFFATLQEAEQYRTMELLKDTNIPRSNYMVFELDVPNPVFKE